MKCYFDGSRVQHPSGEKWLALGGYMASDSFWKRFDREWETEVLQKRMPIAPFLHMTDLVSGNGPFRGWSKERRQQLVWDAVQYIQSLPKRAFCATVYTIDEVARLDLIAQGCTISDPHHIATEWSVGKSFSWYYDTWPSRIEPAFVYFDQGEAFMHRFRQRWLSETKKRLIFDQTFWGLIIEVKALNMRTTPALQAADMIAWAETRNRSSTQDRPFRDLARMIEPVIPSWRVVLNRETLTQIHQPQSENMPAINGGVAKGYDPGDTIGDAKLPEPPGISRSNARLSSGLSYSQGTAS